MKPFEASHGFLHWIFGKDFPPSQKIQQGQIYLGKLVGCPGLGLLGSMVIGSMGCNLLINGIYWGYNPPDPNHLSALPRGHPSIIAHHPKFLGGHVGSCSPLDSPNHSPTSFFWWTPMSSCWIFLVRQKLTPQRFRRGCSIIQLVVSTHLKNISQIGSFPQIGMNRNNI